MTREEIMERLRNIFIDVFEKTDIEISENTDANDIEEWDSLTNISILAVVQDEFGVCFDIDEIVSMKNVGEMLDAIMRKMKL